MAIITKRRKAFTVIYQKVDDNGISNSVYETYYDYQTALARKKEIENSGTYDKMNINPNTTILNFLVQYTNKIGVHQWSNSRYECNIGLINNYISKVIGNKKIKDIQSDFGQSIIKKLQKTPALGKRNQERTKFIPNSMIRSCYILLKSSFDYLVSEQLLENNPFHNCNVPLVKKTKSQKEWNIDFVQHLFNNIHDIRLYIFMHIMFSTGLDIKEISGLSWSDIHIDDELIIKDQCYLCSNKILERLNKNTIQKFNTKRIIKQFEYAGFNQTNTSLTLFYKDKPKKTVHIHKQLALLLKIWREKQKEFLTEENPYDLLIILLNGKPCDDRTMSKLYHKTCEEAHLEDLTLTKFKNFSQKKMHDYPMTNADYFYSTLTASLVLPKQSISTNHAIKLNTQRINQKIKTISHQPKNNDMNILLQQIKDNPELKMQLITKLKAEL